MANELPEQIIPIHLLNKEKEPARYTFAPAGGKSWGVWRKQKFVGIYTDGAFEAVKGYENLSRFIYTALTAQYASAQANREVTNIRTLRMFGISA